MAMPRAPSNMVLETVNTSTVVPTETNVTPFSGFTATASVAYTSSYLMASGAPAGTAPTGTTLVTIDGTSPNYRYLLQSTKEEGKTAPPSELVAMPFTQPADEPFQVSYEAVAYNTHEFKTDETPATTVLGDWMAVNPFLGADGQIFGFPTAVNNDTDASLDPIRSISMADAVADLDYDGAASNLKAGSDIVLPVATNAKNFYFVGTLAEGDAHGILNIFDPAITGLGLNSCTMIQVLATGEEVYTAVADANGFGFYLVKDTNGPKTAVVIQPGKTVQTSTLSGYSQVITNNFTTRIITSTSGNTPMLSVQVPHNTNATIIQTTDVAAPADEPFVAFTLLDSDTFVGVQQSGTAAPYTYRTVTVKRVPGTPDTWTVDANAVSYEFDTSDKYVPVSVVASNLGVSSMWGWSSYTDGANTTSAFGVWRLDSRRGVINTSKYQFFPLNTYANYAGTIDYRLQTGGFAAGYCVASLPTKAADTGATGFACRPSNLSAGTSTLRRAGGYEPTPPEVTLVDMVEDSATEVSPFRQFQVDSLLSQDVRMTASHGTFASTYTGDDWKVTADEKTITCEALVKDAKTSALDGVVNLEGLPKGQDTTVDVVTYGADIVNLPTLDDNDNEYLVTIPPDGSGIACVIPSKHAAGGTLTGAQLVNLNSGAVTALPALDGFTGTLDNVVLAIVAITKDLWLLVVKNSTNNPAFWSYNFSAGTPLAAAVTVTPPAATFTFDQAYCGTDGTTCVFMAINSADYVTIAASSVGTGVGHSAPTGFNVNQAYSISDVGGSTAFLWGDGDNKRYMSMLSPSGFAEPDTAGTTTVAAFPENNAIVGGNMTYAGSVLYILGQTGEVWSLDTAADPAPTAWSTVLEPINGIDSTDNLNLGPVEGSFYFKTSNTPYALYVASTNGTDVYPVSEVATLSQLTTTGCAIGYGATIDMNRNLVNVRGTETDRIVYRVADVPPTPQPTGGPLPTPTPGGGGSGLKAWEKGVITVESVLVIAGLLALLLIFLL